ncbi:MAG: response regulator [Sphingomonas sp.]
MTTQTRLLLVDDEPAIRKLLGTALGRAGYRIVEAGTAREAMNAIQIDKPEAALLDLGLPDRDGLELVPLFKAAGIALIVVSARDATEQKVTALDLGADDYVTKPFDTEEVLARVRTALRHRLALSAESSCVKIDEIEIVLDARVVRKSGADIHLTPKEYALLAELAKRPGKVATHAHLLREIWGPGHDSDVEYLRVAVRGVRQKLGEDLASGSIILNEPGVGYRLRG